jgi:hypothetical protein
MPITIAGPDLKLSTIEREIAAEYRVEQVKDLNDSILRYEEKIREAIASTKATNDYFRALFESVPQP